MTPPCDPFHDATTRRSFDLSFALKATTVQPVSSLSNAIFATTMCGLSSFLVADVFLGICFCRDRLLRRQLQHHCRLRLTQDRQQLDPPIWEFERVVMRG